MNSKWMILLFIPLLITLVPSIGPDERILVTIILEDEPELKTAQEGSRPELASVREQVRQSQDRFISSYRQKAGISAGRSASRNNLDIKARYSSVNAVTAYLTPDEIESLKGDPRVKEISEEVILTISLDSTVPHINTTSSWNNFPIDGMNYSLTGKGQTICVIDTGVNYTHPNIGGCTTAEFLAGSCNRVLGGHDYVNSDNDPMDDQGHGTHVAGIALSNHPTYRGVAPEANLVILKACDGDAQGTCYGTAVQQSLDWCIDNSEALNISVITLSLGDGQAYNNTQPCPSYAMNSFIDSARALGIIVTAASGNENHENGISWPACYANATAIGSSALDDTVWFATNIGWGISLMAPGGTAASQVRSTDYASNGFTGMFGTSMATPHAAGAAAILQQFKKIEKNRSISPQDIETALNASGTPALDVSTGQYFKRINIGSALSYIRELPVITLVAPTPPTGTIQSSAMVTIALRSDRPLASAWVGWGNQNITMQGEGTTWNATVVGHGHYLYRAYGNDTTGNISGSMVRSVTLNDSCRHPYDGMAITESEAFCRSTFNASGISIIADHVVIDCNRSTLIGAGTGISLEGRENITLFDCLFIGYSHPLSATGSFGISVSDSYFNEGIISFTSSDHILFTNNSLMTLNITGNNSRIQNNSIIGRTILAGRNISFIQNSIQTAGSNALTISGSSLSILSNNLSSLGYTLSIAGDSTGIIQNNTIIKGSYHVAVHPSVTIPVDLRYNYFGEIILQSILIEDPAMLAEIDPWYVVPDLSSHSDQDGDNYSATAFGGTDCDDDDPLVHPGAVELPDGKDNNCNGFIDEGFIYGNETTLQTDIANAIILVDGDSDLHLQRQGNLTVILGNSSRAYLSFLFDFDHRYLNLSAVMVNTSPHDGKAQVNVSGLSLDHPKTISIDSLNSSINSYCVLDDESGDAPSETCNLSNEQMVICDGSDHSGYTCTSQDGYFVLTGIMHSTVREQTGCTDRDGDGYGAGCALGDDCNDSDPSRYPGAPCTRECYSGSSLDSTCICTGGAYTCGSASSTPAGGGGSGGGSGGGMPEPQQPEEFSVNYFSLPEGQLTVAEIDTIGLPFTKIGFILEKDARDTTLSIRTTDKAPQLDSMLDVYSTYEIEAVHMDARLVVFEFKVNRSWNPDHEITLYRYRAGWKPLPTIQVGMAGPYRYFKSESDGFSFFAIAGSAPGITTDIPPPEDRGSDIPIPEPRPEQNISSEQVISSEHPQESAPHPVFPQMAIVLITFLFVILFVFSTTENQKDIHSIEHRIEEMIEKKIPDPTIHTELSSRGIKDPATMLSRVRDKINQKKMEHYIMVCMEKGDRETEIKKHLLDHHWTGQEIDSGMAKIKNLLRHKHFPSIVHIEHFIETQLAKGEGLNSIKENLHGKGIHPKHAHDHVSRLKEEHEQKKLVSYIAKRLTIGHERQEIHDHLVTMGWEDKQVWRAMSKAKRILKR